MCLFSIRVWNNQRETGVLKELKEIQYSWRIQMQEVGEMRKMERDETGEIGRGQTVNVPISHVFLKKF